MKKKTISTILWCIMGLLTITIIVLCVKIGMRGPKPIEEQKTASDNDVSAPSLNLAEEVKDDEKEVYEAHFDVVASPDTTSSVNVRSGPGKDYERIGSAYSNNEYVVLEILDSGWTKLDYEGQEGYISSEFLIYKNRQDLGDGTYSYEEVTQDLTNYKAQ